jgi:hypothetical protein
MVIPERDAEMAESGEESQSIWETRRYDDTAGGRLDRSRLRKSRPPAAT